MLYIDPEFEYAGSNVMADVQDEVYNEFEVADCCFVGTLRKGEVSRGSLAIAPLSIAWKQNAHGACRHFRRS